MKFSVIVCRVHISEQKKIINSITIHVMKDFPKRRSVSRLKVILKKITPKRLSKTKMKYDSRGNGFSDNKFGASINTAKITEKIAPAAPVILNFVSLFARAVKYAPSET